LKKALGAAATDELSSDLVVSINRSRTAQPFKLTCPIPSNTPPTTGGAVNRKARARGGGMDGLPHGEESIDQFWRVGRTAANDCDFHSIRPEAIE